VNDFSTVIVTLEALLQECAPAFHACNGSMIGQILGANGGPFVP